MSGKRSRDKGNRRERELVKLFKSHGKAAWRVPLSGSGSISGDILVGCQACNRCRLCREGIGVPDPCRAAGTLEVKARGDGWKVIHRWMEEVEGVVLVADRREPLIVLRLKDELRRADGRQH